MRQIHELFSPDMLHHRLPKTAQVYALLRSAIISLRLEPGEVLNEKDICQQLEISRTPLREAMLRLASEKLVLIRPNARTHVAPIRLVDVLEGQLIRETAELRCVRLAARFFEPKLEGSFDTLFLRKQNALVRKESEEFYSLDEAFHRLICECSGFSNLWHVFDGSKGQLDRIRRLAFPMQDHFAEVIDEHRTIYEAVRNRDEVQAERMMLEHMDSIFDTLKILLQTKGHLLIEDTPAPSLPDVAAAYRRRVR
ncbi:GntR family transcriptional regulator [Pseudomonas sp. NFACC13-1]|uniref:GntR family transcriptional regulator n=1 Tax=Pseudomonas sp. NFACC13-1 TaxID=1566245 RepID=UPI0008904DD1|nr:GntR family transcriptional regulator [Pseudomonas sp. NFACC13-1]SDB67581.1 DNA-binding transcriptional regulator, GntR family [Pseudomonas sp. NFACC13-1]